MEWKIKSNFEVTKSLEEYVESKIVSRLEVFSDYIKELKINLQVTKGNQQENSVEIITTLKNQQHSRVNKVSTKSNDMYKSIDLISDKIFRQTNSFKEKQVRNQVKENTLPFPINYDLDEDELEIVKIKRFDIKPMFVEEAILQMNELGHNFFFYFDASTNVPCVVYKRHDGKYGIIESEFK